MVHLLPFPSFPSFPPNTATSWRRFPASWVPTFALLAMQAAAAAPLNLGDLATGSTVVEANGISGDGRVVVGQTYNGSTYQPFRWSAEHGVQSLSQFSYDYGYANAASGDGGYIVGAARFVSGVNNYRAFIWNAGTGITDLGALPGDLSSSARGVSNDGRVVVGYSLTPAYVSRAFRWTAAGMQDLGSLQNSNTYANGISGDGTVVVGSSAVNGQDHAFRWDAGNAMVDLHPAESLYSRASAANLDGSVVVGSRGSGSRVEAFRWNAATGMQNLGSLGGIVSTARDVSANGAVVVGASEIANRENHAFRWTPSTGMVDLGVLPGQTTSYAYGVSDDGDTVIGKSGNRAFIWNVVLQDLANLQASILRSADSVQQLTSSQTRRLRDLGQQQCLPGATQGFCLGLDATGYRGEANRNGSQRAGQLTGGLRINEQFSVGASTALGRADLREQHAEQHRALAWGVWAAYQQQADNTGWSADASVAVGDSDNRFQRGLTLSDVQRAQARLDISSTALRIAARYGTPVGASLITPEIALSHVRSEQDGYTERNVVFPLSVNGSNSQETYVTLGLRSATPVSAQGTVHLSLAVDTVLNEDTAAIQGSSRIPGFEAFRLNSSLNKRRALPLAMVGYSHAIDANSTLAGGVQMAGSTYQGERPVFGWGAQYRYAF